MYQINKRILADLSSMELCVLFFWAYTGAIATSNEKKICNFYHLSSNEYAKISHKLRSEGLMLGERKINPSYYFEAMNIMMNQQTTWLRNIDAITGEKTPEARYLWNVYLCVRNQDFEHASTIQRPEAFEITPYVFPYVLADPRYKLLLNDDELAYLDENADLDVEVQNGTGLLAVRITPIKYEYDVHVYSAPIEDDPEVRLTPGVGDELLIDDGDLFNCLIIKRNLAAETEHAKTLHDILEQMQVRFFDYNHSLLDSPQKVLDLLAFIHENRDAFFAEWPDTDKLKFRGDMSQCEMHIRVVSNMNWFQIEGNLQIGEKNVSLQHVVDRYLSSMTPTYISIGEDEYVRISKQLERLLRLLTKTSTQVPKYLIGILSDSLQELNVITDDTYEEYISSLRQAQALQPTVPSELQAQLYDYQVEGFRWMLRLDACGAGACLADDMGLGKTLQVIAFLTYKAAIGASLVVAPKSVIPNWVEEVQRFSPGLRVQVINDMRPRADGIMQAGSNTLLLCTYGVLVSELANLKKKQWNVVCLDEAHVIKNHRTKTAQAAICLNAHSRLALTATPLQNHLGDLWTIFDFLNPGLLGSVDDFDNKYLRHSPVVEDMEWLQQLVSPFILRRTKDMVLQSLPKKQVEIQYVHLSARETVIYEGMRARMENEIMGVRGIYNMHVFAGLNKLRMAACSLGLLYSDWRSSSKLDTLRELIYRIIFGEDPNGKILVFSQYTSFLDLVEEQLECNYLRIDGTTSMKRRKQYVQQFQSKEVPVFLCSLHACGVGINLTAANYVILLDPWWNPAIEMQAMDRVYRIGQMRDVKVIRLISKNTIEEKMLHLHRRKQKLSDTILQGTNESWQLTYEDVLYLVGKGMGNVSPPSPC